MYLQLHKEYSLFLSDFN